jgi:hypothetical protein
MEFFSKNIELQVPKIWAWSRGTQLGRITLEHKLGTTITQSWKQRFQHKLGATRTQVWSNKNTMEKSNRNASLEQQEHELGTTRTRPKRIVRMWTWSNKKSCYKLGTTRTWSKRAARIYPRRVTRMWASRASKCELGKITRIWKNIKNIRLESNKNTSLEE